MRQHHEAIAAAGSALPILGPLAVLATVRVIQVAKSALSAFTRQ